jgi:tape measure domain-containing protein
MPCGQPAWHILVGRTAVSAKSGDVQMSSQTSVWLTLRARDDGFGTTIDKAERRAKRLATSSSYGFKQMQRDALAMQTSMVGIWRSMPIIGGLGIASGIALASKALDTFARREGQRAVMESFSGSPEAAAGNLKFLEDTVLRLGINYDEASDGYKKLMINMSALGMPLEKQQATFTKIAEMTRAMKLDAQSSGSVYRAFGEMMSKGFIQAQELKQQLANAIPGSMAAMAKAVGGNVAKVSKMLDKGALGWDKYGDKLIDNLHASATVGLAATLNTFEAQRQRIGYFWSKTLDTFGSTMAKSGATEKILELTKATESWMKANEKEIGEGMVKGVDKASKAFMYLVENRDNIADSLKIIGGGVTALAVATGGAKLVATFSNPIAAAALALGLVVKSIWDADSALEEIQKKHQAGKGKEAEGSPIVNYLEPHEAMGQGIKNVGLGIGRTIMEPTKSESLMQIMAGINQLSYSVIGSAAAAQEAYYEYYNSEADKKSAERWGKAREWAGRKAVGQQKYVDYLYGEGAKWEKKRPKPKYDWNEEQGGALPKLWGGINNNAKPNMQEESKSDLKDALLEAFGNVQLSVTVNAEGGATITPLRAAKGNPLKFTSTNKE